MSVMVPEMSYERGYCRPECTKCSEVCPTGAIRPITKEDKSSVQIGHAVWIAANCVVNTDGVECGNCASHCPTGAVQMVHKEPGNPDSPRIPVVNEARCIGCGYCVTACPYDARWMHPKTGLPVKCMGKGCESLLKAGKDPACVAACPASARAFGDINDPSSAISQRLQHGRSERLMPQKGTRPNFFVVVNK